MKHWGFLSNIVGLIRHNHLPFPIHISNPLSLFIVFALLGLILYSSGILLLVPNLVDTLWPSKAPHLWPEALTQTYLARDISLLTAIKALIFIGVMWTVLKGVHSNIKR